MEAPLPFHTGNTSSPEEEEEEEDEEVSSNQMSPWHLVPVALFAAAGVATNLHAMTNIGRKFDTKKRAIFFLIWLDALLSLSGSLACLVVSIVLAFPHGYVACSVLRAGIALPTVLGLIITAEITAIRYGWQAGRQPYGPSVCGSTKVGSFSRPVQILLLYLNNRIIRVRKVVLSFSQSSPLWTKLRIALSAAVALADITPSGSPDGTRCWTKGGLGAFLSPSSSRTSSSTSRPPSSMQRWTCILRT